MNLQRVICLAIGFAAFLDTALAADTKPAQFTFVDFPSVSQGTTYTSGPINILGIDAPAPISVTGGTYSVGCTGTFTALPGTVTNGQTVCVSQTSATANDAAVDTLLSVGGVSDSFSTLTASYQMLPLTPFATGAGIVKVAELAKPRAASNPLVIDKSLASADLINARTTLGTSINGDTGSTIPNIGIGVLAYVNGGKLEFMGLGNGLPSYVRRLTTFTDVCEVKQAIGEPRARGHAWFVFTTAGADGICGTADDVFVEDFDQGGTKPGIAGILHLDAIDTPVTSQGPGVVNGFLTIEGNPQATLTHRDSNVANPFVLLNLASSDSERLEQTWKTYFIKLIPLGQSSPQLFSYNEIQDVNLVNHRGQTPVLTGPLYTFVNSTGSDGGLANGTYDSDDVYFADGNRLLRMPVNATSTGQVQQVATASENITRIQLPTYSQSQLIFTAYDSSQNGGVYSVPKTSNNAIPTLLQTSTTANTASLAAVAPGVVFINTTQLSSGATTAIRINADGTGTTTTPSAYWAGYTAPTTVDISTAPFDEVNGLNPQSMLLGIVGTGYVNLRAVDPATGDITFTMGKINNVAAGTQVSVHGFGRYAGVTATISRGATSDKDLWYLDTQTANSLHALSLTVGKDDFFLGGN